MAKSSLVALLSVCVLVLVHGSVARPGQQRAPQPRYRDSNECQIERLNAVVPSRRIESEGGFIEFWDNNEKQFVCAGVTACRISINPKGLLLPEFGNGPRLFYISEGSGYTSEIIPGCPETYQSFQQSSESQQNGQQQSQRDQHQKVRRIRKGDILAIPQGVVHWCYNDGDSPLVAVAIMDTSNDLNQLDSNPRKFFLAGHARPQQQKKGSEEGSSFFDNFDPQILAEVWRVSSDVVKKVQSKEDNRGNIVIVKGGLKVVRPPRREQEQEEQEEGSGNGIEESVCNMRLTENIGDPSRADVYSPSGGRLTIVDSNKLSILRYLGLSAAKGFLYDNAIFSPHFNPDAHTVMYVTRGSAQVQIVGNQDKPIFDGELCEGQMLTVPQNFAVMKKAGSDGLEWVSFKTNDNPTMSPLAGKNSIIGSLPVNVLMNAYQISREEAMKLKRNRRDELLVLGPRSQSQEGRAYA